MREIKFEYIFEDTKNFKRVFTLEDLEEDQSTFYNFSVIARRQYTGLKDKDGKEIYEGDILKGKSGKGNNEYDFYVTPEWNENVGAYCIHDETSQWRRGSTKDTHLADSFSACHKVYEFEIVGNIFENPNLLTDEK